MDDDDIMDDDMDDDHDNDKDNNSQKLSITWLSYVCMKKI